MSPCWLSAGACAVLLCGVAAAYSDLEPAPDLNDMWYQEDNEVVHAAAPAQEAGGWAPLLERLLAASAHEDQGIQGYRTPWDAPTQPLLPHKRAPLLDLKSMPGFERFFQTLQGKRAPASPNKQPRWKTKKGRPSSGYMCYFKLCSFRTTN